MNAWTGAAGVLLCAVVNLVSVDSCDLETMGLLHPIISFLSHFLHLGPWMWRLLNLMCISVPLSLKATLDFLKVSIVFFASPDPSHMKG